MKSGARGRVLELARATLRGLGPGATRAEAAVFGDAPPALPPLFILGLPRGGTTLALQVVCHCLAVSYVPEVSSYFPPFPAFAAWLAARRRAPYRSTFESTYGKSPQWYAPSEGLFWNLWLERDRVYEDRSDIDTVAERAIVGTVGRIERIGAGPFVNKNLRNNNRVGLLASLFPSARFLVVVRDPTRVARSLLKGRSDMAGGVDQWFSIKPRNFERLAQEPPAAQVAGQIVGLLEDLARDSQAVGGDRFALVSYETLCRDPNGFIDHLIEFLGAGDGGFRRRATLPGEFRSRAPVAGAEVGQQSGEADRLLESMMSGSPYEGLAGTWLLR